MQLVECVPNFSEGNDRQRIRKITEAMSSVKETVILDVDIGADANRTVVTLAGPPDAVIESGFLGIAEASLQIDMRFQRGAHPRMGATDVFPIVPLQHIDMAACVELSNRLAARVGKELGIPVYLYENSAVSGNRKSLSSIRSGEFESLKEKIINPAWKPDFGPSALHETAGAVAIGARPLLIAFNINLATRNLNIARKIAGDIRESGRRIRQGSVWVRVPGLLKNCKAIGWEMPGYGLTQVSTNLTRYSHTPPHQVYETCRDLALKYGTRVAGSELIGMIPKEALLMAGRHYADHTAENIEENELIALAIRTMGMQSVRPFEPRQKILEYRIHELLQISL